MAWRHRSHRHAGYPLLPSPLSQPSPPAKQIAVSSRAIHHRHAQRVGTIIPGGWRREGPAIRALRRLIDVCHTIMRHVYGHPGHVSINMLQRELRLGVIVIRHVIAV